MMTQVDRERSYRIHKDKLKTVRGSVDQARPFHNPHIYLKLKQMDKLEQENLQMEKANLNLLQRMQKILISDEGLGRRKGKIKGPKSLNIAVREAEQQQIRRDNLGIAYRIQHRQPNIKAKKLEEEFNQRHIYIKDMWNNVTNERFAMFPTPRSDMNEHKSLMSLLATPRELKEEEKKKQKKSRKAKRVAADEKHDVEWGTGNKLPPIKSNTNVEEDEEKEDTKQKK